MMAAVTTCSILLHSHNSLLFSRMRRVTRRLSKRKENLMYWSGGWTLCTTAKQTGKREEERCSFKMLFYPRPQINEAASVALKVKLFAAVVIVVKAFWSCCVPTLYSRTLSGNASLFVPECRAAIHYRKSMLKCISNRKIRKHNFLRGYLLATTNPLLSHKIAHSLPSLPLVGALLGGQE